MNFSPKQLKNGLTQRETVENPMDSHLLRVGSAGGGVRD